LARKEQATPNYNELNANWEIPACLSIGIAGDSPSIAITDATIGKKRTGDPPAPVNRITKSPHPMYRFRFVPLPLAALCLFATRLHAQTPIPSFPGALGYGGATAGACSLSGTNHTGGNVYIVTNLNDSGAGSFRNGVGSSGNIVVFDVGGNIQALSPITCASNIDIEGQTAPGGIQIFGAEVSFFGKSNIICRYMRFRDGTLDPNYPGSSSTNSSTNAANLGDTTNVIMDHCSFEFAAYNNIDAGGNGAVDSTVQYCIFADPILEQQFNFHLQGGPTTMIGNLMANSGGRNPLGKANLQFVNNIVYNWGFAMTTGNSSGTFLWDVINNYFITGPNTTNNSDDYYQVDSGEEAYATGNYEDTSKNGTLQGNTANTVGGATMEAAPWSTTTATLPTVSAQVAFYDVLSNAGPLPRDQVDSQVVSQTLSLGTQGRRFNNQGDTGLGNDGYGTITGGNPLPDSDSSGMPDDWKAAVGISLTNPAAGAVTSPTGYTYLENYLAWKAQPNTWVAKNTTSLPTSVTIDLSQYANGFGVGSTFAVSGTVDGIVTPMTGTQSSTGDFIVTFTPKLNTSGLGGFNWSVNNGVTTLSSTCGVLISQSGPSQSVVWKGDGVNNYWNLSTQNWTAAVATGSAAPFSNGDPVTLTDGGSTSPAVDIDTAVSPGSIAVNGVNSNYVLSGTGVIAGTGGLVMNSAGTLTIENTQADTFSGGMAVNSGTVILDQTPGSGPINLANGTALEINSAGVAIGNTLDLTGACSVSGVNGVAIGPLTGGGTLNLTGNGTRFDFRGSISTFTGSINLGAGSNSIRLYGCDGSATTTFNLGTGTGNIFPRNGNTEGVTTYPLGSLTGGAGTVLGGPTDSVAMVYSVGALNTSTTFAGAISGAGLSLTKVGTGTLTLTANNSGYSGTMTVSAGTLVAANNLGTSNMVVNSGATLVANAIIGGTTTFNAGATLDFGSSTTPGSLGTLTASNGLDIAGGAGVNLYYDLSSSPTATGSNDSITVTDGTLTVSGTVNFDINLTTGQLGAGTYTLIGGGAEMEVPGAPNPWLFLNLPIPTGGITRQTFALSRQVANTKPGYIDLNVTGNAGSLTWTGTNGATWDMDTTSNDWSGASPSTFYDMDSVTFGDSDTNGTVTLNGTLAPSVIYVTSNVTNYTFNGSGIIAGGTELVKSGSSTLYIDTTNPNTFTGPVYLDSGTLDANADISNPLGTGTIYLNGGTLMLPNYGGSGLANSIVVLATSTIQDGSDSSFLTGGGATLSSTSSAVTLDLTFGGGTKTVSMLGSMSAFEGTLALGAGGTVRLDNGGSALAAFNLGTSLMGNRNGNITDYFGSVSGAGGSVLSGRTNGSGETISTYVVGGLNTTTAFAGTIANNGDEGGLNITKVGTGNWTLSGASNLTGVIEIEGGALTISGSCNNGDTTFEAQSGGTLALAGGTISTQTVQIDNGAFFTGYGTLDAGLLAQGTATINGGATLTVNGNFENDGALTVTGDTNLIINVPVDNSGTFVNNGTMTIDGGSGLVVNLPTDGSGSFVNNGLLDIMDSPQTVLPSGYVNNGTVLTSALVAVRQFSKSGNNFTVTIQSYAGHTYQLQKAPDLVTWQSVGAAQGGTGSALVLTDTNATTGGMFYRITVGP
jgi:autotransporter-associated beta strand protein